MANNEDYLDSLLNSISKVKDDIVKEEESTIKRASSISASPKVGADDDFLSANGISDPFENDPFEGIAGKKRKGYSDLDFLKEFEEELLSGEADRFIRDFETELDEEEAAESDSLSDDSLMDSIEGIVSAAKKKANAEMMDDISVAMDEAKDEVALEEESFSMAEMESEETDLSDLSLDSLSLSDDEGSDIQEDTSENEAEEIGSLDDAFESGLSFGGLSDEESLLDENGDVDLDQLLSDGDEALSEINDLMNADALGEAIEGVGDELDENTRRSMEGEDTDKLNTADAPKGFKGFLHKLKLIIFGPDDEEDAPKAAAEISDEDLEGLSEEQIEIMKNLAGETPAEPAEGKKKKKEKKEKPPKEKKEKPAKPPKEKKPKKEKEPKEKDDTPPLPKAMIIIPLLLLVSILALVIGGTNLLSRGVAVSDSKKALERGDYVEAYEALEGIKLKGEEEEALWMKVQILGAVEYEMNCYYIFMREQKYDNALDCLVCALGRAKANEANAQYYDIYEKLMSLKNETSSALMSQFGVSEEEALEIYSLRRRTEYTHRIYDLLEGAGIPY